MDGDSGQFRVYFEEPILGFDEDLDEECEKKKRNQGDSSVFSLHTHRREFCLQGETGLGSGVLRKLEGGKNLILDLTHMRYILDKNGAIN